MNGIGVVIIQLLRPIALDSYGEDRSTGAFILIDPDTNSTVAAGMVTAAAGNTAGGNTAAGENIAASKSERVTAEERAARWGHCGGVLELNGPEELINAIERSLFAAGAITSRIESVDPGLKLHSGLFANIIQSNVQSGLIVLVATVDEGSTLVARAGDQQMTLDASDADNAVSSIHRLLAGAGILHVSGKVYVR